MAHLTNFSFWIFFMRFSHRCVSFLYSWCKTRQKWPKTQIKGRGSALISAWDFIRFLRTVEVHAWYLFRNDRLREIRSFFSRFDLFQVFVLFAWIIKHSRRLQMILKMEVCGWQENRQLTHQCLIFDTIKRQQVQIIEMRRVCLDTV